MMTGVDLKELLESWPYDESNTLRIVEGADGRDILQVRLPLGVEQFELDGRPDGVRPHGNVSAFEHFLGKLDDLRLTGRESAFALGPGDCAELFNEGVLYYLRYLHCFQLKLFALTVRDTERNLKVFDFVKRYAASPEDRIHLEKWRPYILRMNAAARAMIEIERGRHEEALQIIRAAIGVIESLDELPDETFQFERDRSLKALRETVAQIENTRPLSEIERLERQLKKAVAAQEFERAAELRDRIRELRKRSDLG